MHYRFYTGSSYTDRLLSKYQSKMGVDIPLSNIRQGNILDAFGHGLSAIGAAVSKDPLNLVREGVAGVISSMSSQVSSIGGLSSGAGISQAEFGYDQPVIRVYCTGHLTNDDPSSYASSIGCMFMKQDVISNHPGYIKCSNASVSISGTDGERQAVNELLNSGFYYE
jgi:hypothetical protein